MARKIVAIRMDEKVWEKFAEFAERIGVSRNFLLETFVKALISNEGQISVTTSNINMNLVMPIQQTNIMLKNETKAMKNELILDEIREQIKWAMETAGTGGKIPYGIKDRIKKLIEKASYIPPDLFEQARKIILA
jgi:antitoxin component of RelBE/YafQ-DinJ toxin-antitoxin module